MNHVVQAHNISNQNRMLYPGLQPHCYIPNNNF